VRSETSAHLTARSGRKTRPRYFCRFFHLPRYGSADEYAFTVDFASGPVQAETKQKLLLLESIDGAFAQVFPEQGRASQGAIQLTLTNVENLALYYMGALRASLGAAMSPSAPGPGDDIVLSEVTANLPAGGTLEITTGGVIERIRYEGFGEPSDTITVVARGVDGTTAASHAEGDEVTNGEQIRPGQRVQIYAGYADIDEEDYMPFSKLEVIGRRLHEDGQAFVIECADIQRSLRREAFLTASPDAPIEIEGNPFSLMLLMLLSTGTGLNGPYDDWAEEWGVGIPESYIDVTGIETVSGRVAAPSFRFSIRAPIVAKDWIEKEICQPLNCYPVVTQDGRYSIKRYGGFR